MISSKRRCWVAPNRQRLRQPCWAMRGEAPPNRPSFRWWSAQEGPQLSAAFQRADAEEPSRLAFRPWKDLERFVSTAGECRKGGVTTVRFYQADSISQIFCIDNMCPSHVQANLFQHMSLQIMTCRRQNAGPDAQCGHPLVKFFWGSVAPRTHHSQCSIAENKQRLTTPFFPRQNCTKIGQTLTWSTCPGWPPYRVNNTYMMWSEMLSARSIIQTLGQWTRSIAFEGSKCTS